jgi:hypothetical protein
MMIKKAEIIKELKPLMAEYGFKPAGYTFTLVKEEIAIQLELESGRFSTPRFQTYFLNLILRILDTATSENNTMSRGKRKNQGHIVLHQNIDFLTEKTNLLYQVGPDVTVTDIAYSMKQDITSYFFPLSQNLQSVEDLMMFFDRLDSDNGKNRYSFPLAVALAQTGRMDLSKKYFLKSIGDREVIARMANSFGIDLMET